jgi:inner membrane protein
MPSPIGHALAGAAAAWLILPAPRPTSRVAPRELLLPALVFGGVAVLPDLDLLIGTHSGPTHGLGAALLAGLVAWVALRLHRPRVVPAWRVALAVVAAYASHPLLDWMGNDTTPPIGIMALWPFSREYYESSFHVFMAISRRHWLPGFWAHNLTAVAGEIVILGPILAGVLLVRLRAGTRRL